MCQCILHSEDMIHPKLCLSAICLFFLAIFQTVYTASWRFVIKHSWQFQYSTLVCVYTCPIFWPGRWASILLPIQISSITLPQAYSHVPYITDIPWWFPHIHLQFDKSVLWCRSIDNASCTYVYHIRILAPIFLDLWIWYYIYPTFHTFLNGINMHHVA